MKDRVYQLEGCEMMRIMGRKYHWDYQDYQ